MIVSVVKITLAFVEPQIWVVGSGRLTIARTSRLDGGHAILKLAMLLDMVRHWIYLDRVIRRLFSLVNLHGLKSCRSSRRNTAPWMKHRNMTRIELRISSLQQVFAVKRVSKRTPWFLEFSTDLRPSDQPQEQGLWYQHMHSSCKKFLPHELTQSTRTTTWDAILGHVNIED